MLLAAVHYHILSDNALFNFGMLNDTVVIIDAGSRSGEPHQTRGWFNKKVMTRFWTKAGSVIHQDIVAIHREEWRRAGDDMVTALQTYEERWQELRSDSRYFPVLNSLEEDNVHFVPPGGRRPAPAEASSSRGLRATPPLGDHEGGPHLVAASDEELAELLMRRHVSASRENVARRYAATLKEEQGEE